MILTDIMKPLDNLILNQKFFQSLPKMN